MKTGLGWTVLTDTTTPNWKDGRIFMKYCPECERENYTPNVASGICAWCGFDLNEFVSEMTEQKDYNDD
jgi:hypothetical protein